MPKATDNTTPVAEPTVTPVATPEKTEWVVSGITIRKGRSDYKFYDDKFTYLGGLGGENLTEEKATERATRIAMKLEQAKLKVSGK